jgi:hypothetical protein
MEKLTDKYKDWYNQWNKKELEELMKKCNYQLTGTIKLNNGLSYLFCGKKI